jgi:Zn-dependent alcohol dehydrogenase
VSAVSGFCEKCSKFRKRYCDGDRNTCMSILFDTIEALQQENEQLRAQVGKPTIEQVAWIAKCICQNADERGTFRHLIYDIMGYGGEAYQPLCEAGLLRINNSMTARE